MTQLQTKEVIASEAPAAAVDWLTDESAFDEMASEWDALADATDASNIFLRSGWFAAAWKWCSGRSSLAVLRVQTDGRLVGLLPLKREIDRTRWPWLHCLRSLDIPDTQQFSLICAADRVAEVAAAVVTELVRVGQDYDVIQLRKLSATTANLELSRRIQQLPKTAIGISDLCPCIKLEQNWADYYATRTRRLKKGNNLLANRLKKDFRQVVVSREVLDAGERGGAILAELLALSTQSWKQGFDTALHKPMVVDWLGELRRRFGSAGEMVVWSLRLDGAMVAAEVQLDRAGYVAALRADVDEKYSGYGVGSFLNWKVAEALLGSGRTIYNLGPGVSAYKDRWANLLLQLRTATHYGHGVGAWIRWMRDHQLAAAKNRVAALMPRKFRK